MRTAGLWSLVFAGLNLLVTASASAQLVGSSTDAFDSSQGTVIVAHDTIVDPINVFRTSGGFEGGHTLMRNGGAIGAASFIEFRTGTPVRLDGFRLLAKNDQDGCCLRRAFNRFALFADTDGDGTYETTVFDSAINPQYHLEPLSANVGLGRLDMTALLPGPVVAQHWLLETNQGTNLQPFEGARIIELDAIGASDADLDGVFDSDDNCLVVFNPNQENSDGDLLGDACDNCPSVTNDQTDSDGDEYGDACDSQNGDPNEEVVVQDPTPKPPGAPVQLNATFVNPNNFDILAVQPNCFNTSFEVRDPLGNILPPRYLIGPPVKMALASEDPDGALIVLAPGASFTVTCDLAELFPPEVLASGVAGATQPYDVKATYSNDLLDRDCAVPSPDPVECVEVATGIPVFTGEVTSPEVVVEVAGDPASSDDTLDGVCEVSPTKWFPQWIGVPGSTLQVTIAGIPASDTDLTSIRLNSSLAPLSASVSSGEVIAVFDRSSAVGALGSLVPGTRVFPRVTAAFVDGAAADYLRAECAVDIVAAAVVDIDIKPGSDENRINLGSNGNVPVAILSDPEFDATTIAPNTVRLANAGLKVKGKGSGLFSVEDVNQDGLPDLVVHIETQGLELTAISVSAELVGVTFDGTPIFGVDTLQVKE